MKRTFLFPMFILSSAFVLPTTLPASNVEADVDMEKRDKMKVSSSPKSSQQAKKLKREAKKTRKYQLIPMTPMRAGDPIKRYWERRLSDPNNKQDRARFHLDQNSGMLFEKVKAQ